MKYKKTTIYTRKELHELFEEYKTALTSVHLLAIYTAPDISGNSYITGKMDIEYGCIMFRFQGFDIEISFRDNNDLRITYYKRKDNNLPDKIYDYGEDKTYYEKISASNKVEFSKQRWVNLCNVTKLKNVKVTRRNQDNTDMENNCLDEEKLYKFEALYLVFNTLTVKIRPWYDPFIGWADIYINHKKTNRNPFQKS